MIILNINSILLTIFTASRSVPNTPRSQNNYSQSQGTPKSQANVTDSQGTPGQLSGIEEMDDDDDDFLLSNTKDSAMEQS